jgi:LytS/YehU family sensor histidine kinase
LSEDLAALHSIQAELAELVEQHRQIEMRRLVSQAELRALQAQIHPHFLFNAFNTLYGIIPREAHGARRTVLNLADIFRYFLQTQRTYIPLEEELRIVRAYLEIESMRLGGKLRTEIDVPPGALPLPIPILTIQPLVENAVKHGISSLPHGGTVRVHALQDSSGLRIRVSDSGAGFGAAGERAPGVGLENVVRRLQLCYGSGAGIEVDSSTDGTSVSFVVPLRSQEAVHQ